MKNLVKICSIVLLFLVFAIVNVNIIQNTTRQNENTSVLREAIDTAMDVAYLSRDAYYYKPTNDEDNSNSDNKMLAEFTRALTSELGSESVVDVKVISIDHQKGLMDIEVTQSFAYPTRKIGKTTCRATMILNCAEPTPNPILH